MAPVRMNLVKAQKCLEKLKTAVKPEKAKNAWSTSATHRAINPDTLVMSIASFTGVMDNAKDPYEHRRALSETVNEEFTNHLSVLQDVKLLKNLIYSTNAEQGISKMLTGLDTAAEVKKIYVAIRDRLVKSDVIQEDNLDTALKKYLDHQKIEGVTNPYAQYNVSLFMKTSMIDSLISGLNANINGLEDERDALNATTHIQFDFSQASRKILGI